MFAVLHLEPMILGPNSRSKTSWWICSRFTGNQSGSGPWHGLLTGKHYSKLAAVHLLMQTDTVESENKNPPHAEGVILSGGHVSSGCSCPAASTHTCM